MFTFTLALFLTAKTHLFLHLFLQGIDVLIDKFRVFVEILKKKSYDFLDIRRTDFDDDYDQFKRAISNLHVRLLGR